MPLGFLTPFIIRSFSWKQAFVLGVSTGLAFDVLEIVVRQASLTLMT
jgi:glycopeptide antibiotics resistance protein